MLLSAPPGFRGLDPELPVEMYHRHLPHWRQAGATYFVTFRLSDSIPQNKLRDLKFFREEWGHAHPEPRTEADWLSFARQQFRFAEKVMDVGHGACWLRQQDCANLLTDSLEKFHEKRYNLGPYCVMPNHVHVVVRPFIDHPLEKVTGAWKGYTSLQINKMVNRSGPLWTEKSYDRIVRDIDHLWRIVQYIGNNPRKANVPRSQWIRWLNPKWKELEWTFDAEHST